MAQVSAWRNGLSSQNSGIIPPTHSSRVGNMIWQMSFLEHLRMSKEPNTSNKKPGTTLPGTVEKIIKPTDPSLPEKAQIDVEGADDLYREIRIENTLTDENGNKVGLNEGAQVDVTIEADRADTTKKK